MTEAYPKHFSYNYKMDLTKVPTRKTDRVSLHILLPGILLGALLIAIGVYELLGGFNSSKTAFDGMSSAPKYDSAILTPVIFDLVMIAIGFGVIFSLVSLYIKYKKIFFDGSVFIITERLLFGTKKVISENLSNYEGIRVRMEFVQFGLLNKSRYIIELYHEDNEKTIPLYTSIKNKNITSLIRHYAEVLGQPIILMRGGDFVHRTVDEFSQSIVDMDPDLDGYSLELEDYKPKLLSVTEKKDKKIIKVKKFLWDAYNALVIFIIITLSFMLYVIALGEDSIHTLLVVLYSAGGAIILFLFISLFSRDKIIIKSEKIIVYHKFFGVSKKYCEMKKKDIKSIEVTTNPATGRSYLIIETENKCMLFGKKLPLDDLIWVRVFLIKNLRNK